MAMIDGRFTRRNLLKLAGASAGAVMIPKGLITPAQAAGFPAIKEESAVIAFGHVGPISDEGWTFSHHEGLMAVEAAFPKANYSQSENIPYSADATPPFRRFGA